MEHNFLVKAELRNIADCIEKKWFFKKENAEEYFKLLKETGKSQLQSNEVTEEPEELLFITLWDLTEDEILLDSYYFKKLTEKQVLSRSFNIYKSIK